MATTMNLRKILDRKQWEFCTPSPSATVAGACISSSRLYRQFQYLLLNANNAVAYLPEEDAWMDLPNAGMGGTFAAGACGVCTPMGPNGIALSGTTNTIATSLNIQRDLRGFKIRITSGSSAGDERTILSNTVGPNSTITVSNPFTTSANNTSLYQLITTRWWVFNAHTAAPVANQFKYYDYALNTWASGATPAVGGAWGTDGRLIATPSIVDNNNLIFASGTSISGTVSTLSVSGKNWTSNQFSNAYQVRIFAGTGAGQVRTIASNTNTTLTVSTNFSTIPDATSQYHIEGNDDYLYLIGNNAVTMYRYSISNNTWSTISPGVARVSAPGVGLGGNWIWGCTDSDWTNENTILNGRRIYCFRGANTSTIDYYDIPSNSWTSVIPYSPATTTFNTGSKYSIIGGRYIFVQKDITNRFYRFDPVKSELDPLSQFLYPQGAAIVGDTCFDVTYTDGATNITWIYMLLNTTQILLRMMIV